MSDLVEFLLARIAEDEQRARAAANRDGAEAWHWVSGEAWETVSGPQYEDVISAVLVSETTFISPRTGFDLPVRHTTGGETEIRWLAADHIARHDPARVLAECEAKRRIVEIHSLDPDTRVDEECGEVEHNWPCLTLKLLALPYADHPDYREEWRP